MPQLRKDPVLGRWVVLSTERGRRPSDFGPKPDPAEEEGRLCPFCPGNEKMTPPEILRLPTDGPWSVRVVPNRFPALSASGEPDRRGIGIYDQMNGIGAHEVIIETPDHRADLADLGTTGIAGVIQAVRRRVLDLAADDRIRYVLVFKNHGQSAGASLSHSHCQLIATPVVPVLVKEEL
ncbi:MAG TPA: DUF4931 domain-containing protein, partial [Candidatus Krumholzibacterium sp.]|nr:DUF4931 domain-containing protein [Candidatus Krumholzibacterium sp.]